MAPEPDDSTHSAELGLIKLGLVPACMFRAVESFVGLINQLVSFICSFCLTDASTESTVKIPVVKAKRQTGKRLT